MALNGGLQEKLDLDAIAGTDGLLTSTNLPDHDVSAVTSFADYLSRFLYAFSTRAWTAGTPSRKRISAY